MNRISILFAALLISITGSAQVKDEVMINMREKTLYQFVSHGSTTQGSCVNYYITQKQKGGINRKLCTAYYSKQTGRGSVTDSLKNAGFSSEVEKETVRDFSLVIAVTAFSFCCIDSLSKSWNDPSLNTTSDSLFQVSLNLVLFSDGENLQKTFPVTLYTYFKQKELEQRLSKLKGSLHNYSQLNIYYFDLNFQNNLIVRRNPKNYIEPGLPTAFSQYF